MSATRTIIDRDGCYTVSDGVLAVAFDASTGAITRIENADTGQVVVHTETGKPWRLNRFGTEWSIFSNNLPPWLREDEITPTSFDATVAEDGESLKLVWGTSEPGLGVEVEVAFGDRMGEITLTPKVAVSVGTPPPESLTYPVLAEPSLAAESGPPDQFIAPSNSGWLIRRPLDEPDWEAPYPDGYAGCSIQMTAYIQEGVGGLYLATHDPHSTWKTLRFSKREWSVTHYGWDLRDGSDLELDYPVVLSALTSGHWLEAAARYRDWAHTAPWSTGKDGWLAGIDRSAAAWLRDEVGLAIWGAPASLDWSPWYRMWAERAGTPLHICPGWDWPVRLPQSLGKEGWFPARFDPSNVESWEGHYVTPYMCDLFISPQAERFEEIWEPNLIYPYAIFPFTRFSEFDEWVIPTGRPGSDPRVTTDVPFYMCPGTDAQVDLHSWRDLGLIRDHGMDGVCYDISSGNPKQISKCFRGEHGHPPGRGRHMIEAADRVNRASKAAVREATGSYLVQGVETIIENIIGSVDFYVARACAGPLGYHEAWVPAHEDPPGTGRELIPLFEAVYHDIGPVRHDGWLTLADDRGDLFYWAAGRTVLQWGGLLSLHYSYGFSYNPPEAAPGLPDAAQHVNWDGATVDFGPLPALDERKADFVGELAFARTALANRYISHGRMIRPVEVDCPTVGLDFRSSFSSAPSLILDGEWDVPSIIQGAWASPEGNIGLVFVGIGETESNLSIDVDSQELWDLDLSGRAVVVKTRQDGVEQTTRVDGNGKISLHLSMRPRRVYLVEVLDETA